MISAVARLIDEGEDPVVIIDIPHADIELSPRGGYLVCLNVDDAKCLASDLSNAIDHAERMETETK